MQAVPLGRPRTHRKQLLALLHLPRHLENLKGSFVPAITITRRKQIECSDKALLIARAMHAYNNCPGRPVDEAPWPPNTDSALMKYIMMGAYVEDALAKAGF